MQSVTAERRKGTPGPRKGLRGPALPRPGTLTARLSHHVVHTVSGTVDGGSVMAIMGASGSGKTTLLQILAGQRIQLSGEVRPLTCSKYAFGHAISNTSYACPRWRHVDGAIMNTEADAKGLTL